MLYPAVLDRRASDRDAFLRTVRDGLDETVHRLVGTPARARVCARAVCSHAHAVCVCVCVCVHGYVRAARACACVCACGECVCV
jgi:hypothetical protein